MIIEGLEVMNEGLFRINYILTMYVYVLIDVDFDAGYGLEVHYVS